LRLFSFGGYGLALAALALVVFGASECPPYEQPYQWRALGEIFSLIWLLTGLCSKITQLRTSPVSPSYPKQVWGYLKQGLVFYCAARRAPTNVGLTTDLMKISTHLQVDFKDV